MARLLAIEDNAYNLELMTYLLEASGHDVIAAMTGNRGVELARAEQPALVVLDLQLSDATGYEVLGWIRACAELVETPVVAVTAYAMVGDRDSALSGGFDGYLSKPIDPSSFARVIDTYLPVAIRGHEPTSPWRRIDVPSH